MSQIFSSPIQQFCNPPKFVSVPDVMSSWDAAVRGSMTKKHASPCDIHGAHGYPFQTPRKSGKDMQKKIKHENDIHVPQSPSRNGKNRDIPWISRISKQAAHFPVSIKPNNLPPVTDT